jgi:transposase-like protein
MRDVESLCEQAGLGKLSKSTAQRICTELRERFEHFRRRDLYDIHLAALFLDAVFLSVRPDGPKEGVLVAWGFTEAGERVLLSVMLGMRESHEDWLELGRDLIARGLGAPMLIVADGAPGLIKGIEHCWPASDRQHCCVHRVSNLLAKVPERERESVRKTYWQALDEATGEQDGKQRLQALVGELGRAGYTAPPPAAWATTSTRSSCTCATRPATAGAGAAPTCSNARSARSNAAPRSWAASPAKTAA